jgi:hypothetical protein
MGQPCSRLPYNAALQLSFALGAWVDSEDQTQQGEAHRAGGNFTLPENLPGVGITATIYRKLKRSTWQKIH